ncbi:glutathione S-transferase T3-like [Salvia splendens]|uniref:glutathione S-transferase T3-like n=1 Tax=Salvia splendens TaxID=180675 RepID=UPI001C26BBA7|nr:glutathione S-transferase T3-like [Salvia splendens]
MDLSSPPVSTNEFDISDMELVTERGNVAAADDEGPKKYSPEETLWLARNFVDISEEPVIGNQQSDKVFWERIAQKYNAGRPRGTLERSYVKLRKHWGRVQREMTKWNGKWTNVVQMWPSGHIKMDLVAKANVEFFSDGKKHFKYYDVWKLIHKSPKYTGGAEEAGSGMSNRTKKKTEKGAKRAKVQQPQFKPSFLALLKSNQ